MMVIAQANPGRCEVRKRGTGGGAPPGLTGDRVVPGRPAIRSPAPPAGFPEGLLAARHVDPPRTGRQPLYACQLSAGHWFSTADTAAAARVAIPPVVLGPAIARAARVRVGQVLTLDVAAAGRSGSVPRSPPG